MFEGPTSEGQMSERRNSAACHPLNRLSSTQSLVIPSGARELGSCLHRVRCRLIQTPGSLASLGM